MKKTAFDKYAQVQLLAFYDELEKIAELEKDAFLGTAIRGVGKGIGKAVTGVRSGVGKALTGAGKKIMPAALPKATAGPGWAMGQKGLTATPSSSWGKIVRGKGTPALSQPQAQAQFAHRQIEQTPQALAGKKKLMATLQQRGMAIPDELRAELSIPVARNVMTKIPQTAPSLGGTRVDRFTGRSMVNRTGGGDGTAVAQMTPAPVMRPRPRLQAQPAM